jgi:hypothetical protein
MAAIGLFFNGAAVLEQVSIGPCFPKRRGFSSVLGRIASIAGDFRSE